MKKIFMVPAILALSILVSAASAAPPIQPSDVQSPKLAMSKVGGGWVTGYRCIVDNNVGGTWFWVHPNRRSSARQAMTVCQYNTPVGAGCVLRGCDYGTFWVN